MPRRPSFWESDDPDAAPPAAATRELDDDAGPLSPGERIGRWQVEALLGEGGSARVYRCRQGKARAAVKLLEPDADREAFEREGRLLQRIRHPRVVRVLELGDGWLALELLEGRTLEARLQRPMPAAAAARLLGQALDALEAVHAARLVHRDVKPSNLFLSMSDSQLTLLDFGIAREGARVAPTAATHVRGTLDYMSPEQLDGKKVGPKSDLYALGCVAHRMLFGRPPFSGSLREQLEARQRPPAAGDGPLAPLLEALLAPRERDRPASASEAKALLPR